MGEEGGAAPRRDIIFINLFGLLIVKKSFLKFKNKLYKKN